MGAAQGRRLAKASKVSLSRRLGQATEVASVIDAASLRTSVRDLTDPPSPAASMKKAGVALLVAPDPFTGIAGVALLGTYLAVRKREPARVDTLTKEVRKLMEEFGTLEF